MSDDVYFVVQMNIICLLAFAIGVTVLVQHPDWFGGCTPC